jgi:hypothetical protein
LGIHVREAKATENTKLGVIGMTSKKRKIGSVMEIGFSWLNIEKICCSA